MGRRLKKHFRKQKTTRNSNQHIYIPIALLILIVISLFIILKSGVLNTNKPQNNLQTKAAGYSCPTTSSQNYSSNHASGGPEKLGQSLDNHPEINLSLRGWGEVNKEKNPVDYGGDTDPVTPPSIGSIFSGRLPNIVKTYVVYEWDFGNNKSLAPAPATPQWPVHLIGLDAAPGEPLLGLGAGRKIDESGNAYMVLYATRDKITMTHSGGDNLSDGYLMYFVDLCVDPNLLAAYERDNAGGRGQLPVIRPGQVFGYGNGSDVKFGIRDSMSFMDPRARKDWWQIGPPSGPTYPPVDRPTVPSTPTVATYNTPTIPPAVSSPTNAPTFPSPTSIPFQPSVTSFQPKISDYQPPITYYQPVTIMPQPTSMPTITLIPTPTKTFSQKISTSGVFLLAKDLMGKLDYYLKVILP